MEVDDLDDDPEAWHANAHITNANYQGKKMVFLLFINRRCRAMIDTFI